jgi:hypothetical protein
MKDKCIHKQLCLYGEICVYKYTTNSNINISTYLKNKCIYKSKHLLTPYENIIKGD